MAEQNINKAADLINEIIADGYTKGLNPAVDQLVGQFQNTLLEMIQGMQKGLKRQLESNPDMSKQRQVEFLTDTFKQDALGIDTSSFFENIAQKTVTLQNIPRELEKIHNDVKKHIGAYSEQDIRKTFKKEYVTTSLSQLEKDLISATIDNTVDNHYNTTNNKLTRLHREVKDFVESSNVKGMDKDTIIGMLQKDYKAQNPGEKEQNLFLAAIENTVDNSYNATKNPLDAFTQKPSVSNTPLPGKNNKKNSKTNKINTQQKRRLRGG